MSDFSEEAEAQWAEAKAEGKLDSDDLFADYKLHHKELDSCFNDAVAVQYVKQTIRQKMKEARVDELENLMNDFSKKLEETLRHLSKQTALADRAAELATTPNGVKDASKRFEWSIGEAHQAIIQLVDKEVIGADEPTESDVHTADMRYFSSTGLMLENNKSKNKLRVTQRAIINGGKQDD